VTDQPDPTPADRDPADPALIDPDPAVAAEARREDRAAKEAEAERRRRRDRVFGAVLADTTSDERGDRPVEDGSRDAELRRNVPPHHG
jgi:hypothetical protein